jgi:hypothetical protein
MLDPRSGRAGDIERRIGRARVEHDSLVAEIDRREDGRQMSFRIPSDDHGGYRGAAHVRR